MPFFRHLFEASGCALKYGSRVLKDPLHYARDVVTVRHIIPKCGEAMWLAPLLHFGELLEIELLILDRAPVVFRVIHREARRECPVRANDEPIMTGSATPVLN